MSFPTVNLPAYLWAVALVELTPGPNMAYLAVVAARHGRRAGFETVVGITLGLGVYLAATVAGLGELIAVSPVVLPVLRWLGAAYLVWLAVDVLAGTDPRTGAAETSPSGLRNGMRGFITNILNPKAAVFYLVFLPGFLDPSLGDLTGQMVGLGSIHLAVSVAVHALIVQTAAASRPRLARRMQTFSVRAGFAFALALTAVWIVWGGRSG